MNESGTVGVKSKDNGFQLLPSSRFLGFEFERKGDVNKFQWRKASKTKCSLVVMDNLYFQCIECS